MKGRDVGKVLCADCLFLDSKLIGEYGLISVFPQARNDGAYRSTYDELLQRSKGQSAFFSRVLPDLMRAWGPFMPAAGLNAGYLVRPHLVTVTSLFLDRYIRVLARLNQFLDCDVVVMSVDPLPDCSTINYDPSTWHFNQHLILRIMTGLGFPSVSVLAKNAYPENSCDKTQANLLFSPSRSVVSPIIRRYWGMIRRLSIWIDSSIYSEVPSFLSPGFVYDDYYVSKAFLYKPLGPIRCQKITMPASLPSRNLELRALLRSSLDSVDPSSFIDLLRQCLPEKLLHHRAELALDIWRDIMVDWFPITYLEVLPMALDNAHNDMSKVAKVFIGSDLTSPLGRLYSVVARQLGMSVVGVAHNVGTQGYIEDSSLHAQFEYSHYDATFTSGWTRIDDHLPQCKAIPVPSPRLSERPLSSDYTSNRNMAIKEKRDVLFLSNRFHRFPSVSTCGQARVDFIDEITDSQEKLMSALNESGCSVDHKPYHMLFVDLYPEHYKRLALAGGSTYRLIESTQKGLSVDLIKTAKIVLWDQIGSGTIECFTSKVPTMVYWQRIYSREAPWAKDLVSELELCGVVHSSPETLVRELQIYLSDPKAWMADVRRLRAIEAFCYHFGRTDKNWAKIWRETLKSLVQHPPKHFVN